MNGQVASLVVEVATIPEVMEHGIGTIAIAQPVKVAKFEKRCWLYIVTMPISWILTLWVVTKKKVRRLLGKPDPNINTFWFDGLGLSCREIKNVRGKGVRYL